MSPWVESTEELRNLVATLERGSAIAIDTESDSLHSYREKVCLIQLAGEGVPARLVDPLRLADLSPLQPLLQNQAVVKVLHGADYDVTTLKRDFGWELRPLFDTMIAARFLGLPSIGLQGVAEAELGVKLSKASQKDDWSRRPLRPSQEQYALADVEHLLELHDRLAARLQERGRLSWAVEECAAVSALPAARRERDPEAWRRIKGSQRLPALGLAVLRELHVWREGVAEAQDRPPFKVLGNDVLLALGATPPRSAEELRKHPAWRPSMERHARGVLPALERGHASREDLRQPRAARAQVAPVAQRRAAALRAWRAGRAKTLELDVAVVMPQRLIDALAEVGPKDAAGLAGVDGLRRWRIEAFGPELIAAMAQ